MREVKENASQKLMKGDEEVRGLGDPASRR